MSVAMKVALRIGHIKRGVPFAITGFYALGSHTSVQKALSRLTKDGVLERVSKGFYVRPKPMVSMPSIKVTTSAESVAKAWAREHGYKLVSQGQEAAYRLGFQSQAPMKKVFWSNGPSREFRVGNQVVEIRRISSQKLRWQNAPEGALLRGLLVTPPESIEVFELEQAMRRLSLTPVEERLAVKKLCALPLLNGWQAKLEQLGQIN